MKEKLTRNTGLKILSIILAVVLWLVITNLDDPVITETFYNMDVKILNEDAIKSLGQVYDIIEGDQVNFTVAARRSIMKELSDSDFEVTADFSKLSDVNAVAIDISCPRYGDKVTVTNGRYQVMKVNLEDLEKKHFKVNVIQKGGPAKGYYVAEKTANTIIQVSGPESKINSIAQIVVEVDVTDVAGTYRTTEKPKALDVDGKEINSDNLEFSDRTVSVNIVMYKTKTIDLLIKTSGKPADGYMVTEVDYEPKSFEIAGTDEALSKVSSLTVSEDTEGVSQDIEKEINLQEQLEDGLVCVGDTQTAVVNIKIEESMEKEIQLGTGNIEIRNKPGGITAEIISLLPVMVKVSGPEKEIKDLKVRDINPYIDLTNYTAGVYNVSIHINTEANITLLNKPTVNVRLN